MVTQADLLLPFVATELQSELTTTRSEYFQTIQGSAQFNSKSDMPPCLGGTNVKEMKPHLLEALARRRESEERVKIL